MNKKTVATCLAGTMLWSTVATSAMAINVDQLVDVEKNDWFYPYVQYVTAQDYMEGIGENKFAPAMEMNRAMFVTVLYRLDEPTGVSGDSQFTDVPAGTWYTEAVNWAVKNGIVLGMGDNTFAPTASITREQMCTMMSRFVEYRAKKDNKTFKNQSEEKTFADADRISEYAKEAVKKCQLWGLMEGDEKGNFNPLNNATRAEVAAVIKRLDTLLASGQSQGGGGGGGGFVPSESANYVVKATLDLPDSLTTFQPDLMATYNNVTVGNTTTFGDIANALVTGENVRGLKNAMSEALNKVKGKTITQTIDGQTVTISVNDNGVISASMAVKVTDLTKNTRANDDALKDLINKLQNGGEMSFKKDELLAMGDLLEKIETVNNMKPDEIQQKINQVAAENPEFEQAIKGMTPDAVLNAASDYQTQVEEILDEIGVTKEDIDAGLDNWDNDQVSNPVIKEPVLMNVQMDLGKYFIDATNKFTANKEAAINRLQAELYPNGGETIDTGLAGAMYDQANPEKYLKNNNDGTLTLKSAEEYYAWLNASVNASVAFYKSLNEDEAFYQSLLQRVENKYQNGYGVSYTGSIDDMAALLGDTNNVFTDADNKFRNGMNFSVTVNVNEGTYKSWKDLLSGKFDQASMLPGTLPSALNSLLGNYTLTFNIAKQ